MKHILKILLRSATVFSITVVLFSCTNNTQKARDFLADKNLPIGKSKNAFHIYKDSGRITSKLITPLLLDFTNRKDHPYNEFPSGIKIVNFENKGADSVTITGDYALSYEKTSVSEIKGNVIVINHTDQSVLETDQLFWDQKTNYFISEKAFKLIKQNDTIYGIGFESKDDLTKHLAKKTTGKLETKED
ncbi:LPS export ABC transporter periplasmic protein LptC [Polaribacter sp. R77954]|uniref:LPS export ABC transporter periplasmic protein LptC n=1 Tax=Polaribacter sp. R77954 TaxID=3093870 RepID=UPI0037CC4CAB